MKIEVEALKHILEERDAEILATRDKVRFRCKEPQKTSVKTSMGILDLTRWVKDGPMIQRKRAVSFTRSQFDGLVIGLLIPVSKLPKRGNFVLRL